MGSNGHKLLGESNLLIHQTFFQITRLNGAEQVHQERNAAQGSQPCDFNLGGDMVCVG